MFNIWPQFDWRRLLKELRESLKSDIVDEVEKVEDEGDTITGESFKDSYL